ncbi:MAG: hypothetical protein ACKVOW_09990 [Chitinophagaceae bacterium]
MKNIVGNKFSFLINSLLLLVLVACNQAPKEDELAKNLTLLDEQSGQYKPQKTDIDLQSSHIAVKVIYDNGQWTLDSTYSEQRPGRMPYLLKGSGYFEVSYTDATGKEIGKYKYEDPTLRRVCEGEKPGFSKIDKTVVEILLPGNAPVDRFELKQDGKKIISFKVPPIRKRGAGDQNPNTISPVKDTIDQKKKE